MREEYDFSNAVKNPYVGKPQAADNNPSRWTGNWLF